LLKILFLALTPAAFTLPVPHRRLHRLQHDRLASGQPARSAQGRDRRPQREAGQSDVRRGHQNCLRSLERCGD
jgi:hypothetical protein